MKANAEIGFYGKLPMLGDFVSRHLPIEFISIWDNWLQAALASSQQQMDSAWLNSYLTCPIWRFILSSGVCGKTAWAGILMPSVDKIGRYFPFTVAVPFPQSPYLPHLFTLGDEWFEQLEAGALRGLEGDMDVSSFEQLMQNIPSFLLPEVDRKSAAVADIFTGLNSYLSHCKSGYSLWTTSDGEEMQDKKLLAYEKLPPCQNFSSFLSGDVDSMTIQSGTLFVCHTATPTSLAEMTTPKPWQSWAVTDIGKRRQQNEDAILNRPEVGLWAVADGMGGHEAGDVASQMVVNALERIYPAVNLQISLKTVRDCLQEVNSQLRNLAKQKHQNQIIGTTVVVLLANRQNCAFIWAGDSRLYRFRNRQLQQLTQDHCPDIEEIIDNRKGKNCNEITRAIGANDILELDCGLSDIRSGDIFLLCSDGLDKEMTAQEIVQTMLAQKPENMANALLSLTLQREARDNISIVVVSMID
jgi:type VI secretion system protein ImpM